MPLQQRREVISLDTNHTSSFLGPAQGQGAGTDQGANTGRVEEMPWTWHPEAMGALAPEHT